MKLLVQQLQDQDPMNPTDASQFTSQIMSYASYSTLTSMDSSLTSMSSALTSLQESVSSITSALSSSTTSTSSS